MFRRYELDNCPVLDGVKNFGLGMSYKVKKSTKKISKIVDVEAEVLPPPIVRVWGEVYSDEEKEDTKVKKRTKKESIKSEQTVKKEKATGSKDRV